MGHMYVEVFDEIQIYVVLSPFIARALGVKSRDIFMVDIPSELDDLKSVCSKVLVGFPKVMVFCHRVEA